MKLIKIGAEWCNPCKVLDKQLENFNSCEIVKYDVEEEYEVADKYNVRNIPVTILLDDEDNEVKRWVGTFDVKEIDKEIENFQTNA